MPRASRACSPRSARPARTPCVACNRMCIVQLYIPIHGINTSVVDPKLFLQGPWPSVARGTAAWGPARRQSSCPQRGGTRGAGLSGAERAERAVDVAVRRPRLLEPRHHSLTRPRERGVGGRNARQGSRARTQAAHGRAAAPPNGSGKIRPEPPRIRRERGRIRRGRARSQPRRPAANAVKQVKIWGSGKEAREEESVGVRPPALRRVAQPPRRDAPVPAPRLARSRGVQPRRRCFPRLRRAGPRRFPRLRRAGKRCPARRSGDPCRGRRVVRPASGASRRERQRRGPRQPRGRRGFRVRRAGADVRCE